MTSDVSAIRIIAHVVRSARAAGVDQVGQTQRAVDALLQVCPDIPHDEARSLVQLCTQSFCPETWRYRHDSTLDRMLPRGAAVDPHP